MMHISEQKACGKQMKFENVVTQIYSQLITAHRLQTCVNFVSTTLPLLPLNSCGGEHRIMKHI
jgi:hypothetical protein